jgi:uncharacterized membrane protein YdjX (TVP38/TMEM64 family)
MKWLIAVAIVILVTLFFVFDLQSYFSLAQLKEQKDALTSVFNEKPITTTLVFFLVYVALTALALPAAAILTLAGGAVFGFWKGLVLVSFASTIGATIAFLLTRYLFRDAIQKRFGDKLASVNKGINQDGAFYVFGLRLVPIFPFFAVNSLLALTPLSLVTYYWASQLGMLAGTAVYVNAGTQLAKINALSDIVSAPLLLSFVLLGVFPILAKQLMKRLKSPATHT